MRTIQKRKAIKCLEGDRLVLSNKPYVLVRTQEDGEQDLVQIARTADREGGWLFYAGSNSWLHMPSKHKEEVMSDGTIEMRFKWWGFYESSLGKVPVHYHIHPESFVKKLVAETLKRVPDSSSPDLERIASEICFAWAILPSTADLALLTGLGKGYEHRIVTTRGVTILKCNPTVQAVETPDLGQLLREHGATFADEGFQRGIGKTLEHANRYFNGYVTIEFKGTAT